jgi:hypothetical protein
MTPINVDGVQVIFEGIRRLRWEHQPTWRHQPATLGRPRPAEWMVGSIWPDKTTGARVRRQIENGQRTIVVIDGTTPIATVSREHVPTVPVGAVELDGPDEGIRTLSIPPLTWLSPADRARGEAFSASVSGITCSAFAPGSPVLVERDLIGTRKALRFVYRAGDISFGELRDSIREMYQPGPKAAGLHSLDRTIPDHRVA